ncbi:hypothetical protein [Methanolacinia paynteri]|uniref:hypothetical protein n=1 Tax=Methanolacinia paynteri TaxID=230356 RepID=UPI0012F69277|nr:hypothetical protein [Methanolacinia paynteri]
MIFLSAILELGKFFVIIILLPAVFSGIFSLLLYYSLTKIRPPADRFAPVVPVVVGLIFCVLLAFFGNFWSSVLLDLAIMSMGVLTSFMAVRRLFPGRFLYVVLFLCTVIAVCGRFIYGFGMVFGSGGSGSPVFQLLTSFSSSNEVFFIMNSVALYVEMVIISAVLFGLIFVFMKFFWRISEMG